MTFACLTSDKGEGGSVALVMTTGKHGLIPKSAPIRLTTTALRGAVHTVSLSETVLSTAVPTIQQSVTRDTLPATEGWGQLLSLQTLDCRHCLATYYYLISNIFFPGLVASLLHQLSIFCLAMAQSPLAEQKNVFVCAYSQNPHSHTAPTHAFSSWGTSVLINTQSSAHDIPTPHHKFFFLLFTRIYCISRTILFCREGRRKVCMPCLISP